MKHCKEKMKFSEWLKRYEEATALITDPYEAMQELELDSLAGQVLDQDSLNRAYRKMQIIHHPDAQAGSESPDNIKSKRINAAKELLDSYVGRILPSSLGTRPEPQYSGSSTYSGGTRTRPEDRNRKFYTSSEVDDWANSLVEKNYLQLVIREHVKWLPIFVSIDGFDRPIGSKIRTEKLTKKGKTVEASEIVELIKQAMQSDNSSFPNDILDMQMNDNWKEGWLTYKTPKGYRSISFLVIKAPVRKQPGVGMTAMQAENYLLGANEDLRRLGNGYLGFPEHFNGRTFIGVMVKFQPKVMNVVKRYRRPQYGTTKVEEIKITSTAYGKLTSEYLDKVVDYILRRRYEKDEEV